MRVFVAIELDERLVRALGELQRRLKAEPGGRWVRWVAPEGIHLTLKFLGEIERDQVAQVQAAVDAACVGFGPFDLIAQGLGGFPNSRNPNNIWVGLGGDVERAAGLAERVEDECAARGVPRDVRGFTPHLTLGRVKRDARPVDRAQVGELIRRPGAEAAEVGLLRVEAVYLMESDLRPGGAIYSVLGRTPLAYGIPRPP